MFTSFANKLYQSVAKIPFDYLVWITWGSFAFIFLLSFVLTLANRKIRALPKGPFLCLVNAYAALTLALFSINCELAPSLFTAVVFWVVGYLFYGVLCFASRERVPRAAGMPPALSEIPAQIRKSEIVPPAPAAKNNVRLEHAVSVTDKLLSKNLGKGDRQELERLKSTLAVLQIKGTLTPAESEILNENFNALLKLMAKYNV